MPDVRERLLRAERRLFDHYGLSVETRELLLDDPPVRVRVLESGAGRPLVVIHGSGMSGATWAPLMAHLAGRRVVAVDLPGFGLSDPFDYSGRTLRRHAVAQLGSLLDALGLVRADLVGTSLGAMWALCFALEAPERVSRLVAIGVPAVALEGMHPDPGFALLSRPVLGALAVRLSPPPAPLMRRSMTGVLGRRAVELTPDEWFEVARLDMRTPAWRRAMRSHMLLAVRSGRPVPENFLTPDELGRLKTPVLFIWGQDDVYGPPAIGLRAAEQMPCARLEVVSGNHAPFLDHPAECARMIEAFTAVAPDGEP
jgi:pimeloyl-ACP methyl ester carboxylesterase